MVFSHRRPNDGDNMAPAPYPEIVSSYLQYHRYRLGCQKKGDLDLSAARFFYPSTLLPLRYLVQSSNPRPNIIPPGDSRAASYLELVDSSKSWATGCPYVEITQHDKAVEENLNDFFVKHFENGENCGGQNAFKLLIGELVDNVEQHSESSKAFVEGQIYRKKGFTELCILDNGISIPGAFKEHRKAYANDADAIIQAIRGVSTKPDGQRGTGLGFVSNLITQGLCGEAFISSGNGFIYLAEGHPGLIFNDERIFHRGTIIGLRMPYAAKKVDVGAYINTRPNIEKLLKNGK